MVYGVLKLINFAHSELFTIGGFIGYGILRLGSAGTLAAPAIWVLPAILLAGMGSGLGGILLERIAYRPLRSQPRINALLTTVGVSLLLQNVGIRLFGARARGVPVVEINSKIFTLVVLLVSLAGLWTLVHRSSIGIKMRAVAEAPDVAELCGVRREPIYIITFFAGGFLAGVASVAWILLYGSVNPQMGFEVGMRAFVISVVGGIGSLSGCCAAALLLGILDSLLQAYLPPGMAPHRPALLFFLLLACLVLRPTGIVKAQSNSTPTWN
jgi:branched-chain amino acid transport system permease protein